MQSKYEIGLRFLSSSPELINNSVETIITEYFDVYVLTNLEKLLKIERSEVIKDCLNHAKNDKQIDFEKKLITIYGKTTNREIKNIFMVLRRLLQGELDCSEPLMGHVLKKMKYDDCKASEELIQQYNKLICECISIKMEEFFQSRSFSPFPRF